MSANILYGKPVKEHIQSNVIAQVAKLGRQPHIATVGFVDNDEWVTYANSLARASSLYHCTLANHYVNSNNSAKDMADIVRSLNADKAVDGIIVQQPLPKQFRYVADIVEPTKDIDGCTLHNALSMLHGKENIAPATPSAVVKMLEYYNIPIHGSNIAIIGRGPAVGKPLMLMLLNRNATITVCHSHTNNLSDICQDKDIIVSACGVAKLVDDKFVNANTTIIDVGLSFVDGVAYGDVDFDKVVPCCANISPVPRGIGPVTNACLFANATLCAMARGNQC